MEPAHFFHELVAWAKVQVIGVGEDHRRAHASEILWVERLDGGKRADRHECRRLDRTVRGHEKAGSRRAGLFLD